MDDTTIDLKRYLGILRRWAWLIIIGLVVGALLALLISLNTRPVYQATTKVLAARVSSAASTDSTYLSDQQLTMTYVQLVSAQSVREAVSKLVGYPVAGGRVRAQQIQTSQVIQITVEDYDPQRAADIANAYVTVLIEKNEELQAGRYAAMEASLLAQKTQIENQIASLQSQIDQASTQTIEEQKQWIESQISALQAESSRLEAEIAKMTPTTLEEEAALNEKKARLSQIKPLLSLYQQSYTNLVVYGKLVEGANTTSTSNLSLLKTTQDLYQKIYLSILSNLESVRLARLQNTPNVVQLDPARVPRVPVRPRTMTNTIFGGLIGLILATVGVILKEYLDDTLKTPEEVEQYTGLSIIGYVADMDSSDGSEEGIYVVKQPRSPIAESFRSLRTNLEFTAVDRPLQIIAVTSPGASEGKTTIACNLAAIIAQGGKRVLLMDADLRRPRVHRLTGVSNRTGLSDVFRGQFSLGAVQRPCEEVPGLSVITSGSLPPNPAELLSSAKMAQILEELRAQADVIVIDSPPTLVADSQLISSKADGVLLVLQPGNTHIDAAKATMAQLKRAEAKMVGVVLNRITRGGSYYYGGYKYYSRGDYKYHYYSEEGRSSGRKLIGRKAAKKTS